MTTGNQIQKGGVPENLRNQLALAVRSIKWSYAIFWSISAKQPGVLEWGDGYYNGDIKTRKTVQGVESIELNATDHLGLQRSDQLRELYNTLLAGESNPQGKRSKVALSPEDLTDAEWHFLVCMSFIFNIGQGLAGRTLAQNQTFWLCNAHLADTKVFSHSLLAKSASIQTVVCFPHSGGVIELGVTKLVSEDLNLIHHIKTSFLESPCAVVSQIPDNIISNNGLLCEVLENANMPEDDLDQVLDCPTNNSNDFAEDLRRGELNLVDIMDEEAFQMRSCHFMDDTISHCINNSTNSSDCISQTYENTSRIIPHAERNNVINDTINDIQEGNQQKQKQKLKQNSSGLQGDDIHYQKVLSNLWKSSHQLIFGPFFRNGDRKSSFVSWKNKLLDDKVSQTTTPQRLLKKILIGVSRMHENFRLKSGRDNGKRGSLSRSEVDETDKNHVLSERRRREKINERFTVLGSLIPSGGKADKVSILDHAIDYVRELERKVEELESYKQEMEQESTRLRNCRHAIELTHDSYGPQQTSNINKPLRNKRKSCDMNKIGSENKRVQPTESSMDNVAVNVTNKDVLIEIRCCWRECTVIEIMEAISKLQLDSQTVQSSNNDGIPSLTIKAKCKGLQVAPAFMIRQALEKVILKP